MRRTPTTLSREFPSVREKSQEPHPYSAARGLPCLLGDTGRSGGKMRGGAWVKALTWSLTPHPTSQALRGSTDFGSSPQIGGDGEDLGQRQPAAAGTCRGQAEWPRTSVTSTGFLSWGHRGQLKPRPGKQPVRKIRASFGRHGNHTDTTQTPTASHPSCEAMARGSVSSGEKREQHRPQR